MTCVRLESCSNCCMLPSLGQLPFLKFLEIQDFNEVETIGAEFYKNDTDDSSLETPFPCLECLSFRKMPCWKVWHSSDSDGDVFGQLKLLTIFDCPMLTGNLPNHLPSLETLEINRCMQLISSLPTAPAIRELRIDGSYKVELQLQELPISLQSLSVGGCELVESVIKAIAINHPTNLESLGISDCLSDISFSMEFLPQCLKGLQIWNCGKLEFPKQEQHSWLESLEIDNSCDSLTLLRLEEFPRLKILELKGCENLESLSMSPLQDSTLEELFIHGCPNFLWFPKEGLAASNMTYFTVMGCKKLKSLPHDMKTHLPELRRLELSDCPEIDSFPQGGLPAKIGALVIMNCEKLLRGLSSIGIPQGLTFLSIGGDLCESVKSFPEEGLVPKLPSLKTLHLCELPNLEILNCKELLLHPSLQQLTIEYCPKLENMEGQNLPLSLAKLEIFQSPLLEERCKMNHPQIWPKISHIPGIRVDWKWISS